MVIISIILSCNKNNDDEKSNNFSPNSSNFYKNKSISDSNRLDTINYSNNTSFITKLYVTKTGMIFNEINVDPKSSINIDVSKLDPQEINQLKISFSVVLDKTKIILDNVDCNSTKNIDLNNKVFNNKTMSFSATENIGKDVFFCELKNDWKYEVEPSGIPNDPGDDGKKDLTGIITNSYGIRDDVLRWIFLESNSNERQIQKLISITKNYSNLINSYQDKLNNIKNINYLLQDASELYSLYSNSNNATNVLLQLEYNLVNTKDRFIALQKSSVNFSGNIFYIKENMFKKNILKNDLCQSKIKTKYYFGNGMFTNPLDANLSLNELRVLVLNNYKSEEKKRIEDYSSFGLAYNDNEQAIFQLIHVLEQKIEDKHWNDVLKWLNETEATPKSIQQDIINISKLHQEYSDSDLRNFIDMYTNDLNELNTVVLVSHSQGNFYANEVSRSLIQSTDTHLQRLFFYNFYNYQVATPVSFIGNSIIPQVNPVVNKNISTKYGNISKCESSQIMSGSSLTDDIKKCSFWRYATNDNDRIIEGVSLGFNTLPANFFTDKNKDTDKILHHSFIGSYLSNPVFNEIINGFLTSVSKNSIIIDNSDTASITASYLWNNPIDHYVSRVKSFSDLSKQDYWNSIWPNDFDESTIPKYNSRWNNEKALKSATIFINYLSDSEISDNNYLDFYNKNISNKSYPFLNSNDFFQALMDDFKTDPQNNFLNYLTDSLYSSNLPCFSNSHETNIKFIFNCYFDSITPSNNFSNNYVSIENISQNQLNFLVKPHEINSHEKYNFSMIPNITFTDDIYSDDINLLVNFNGKCKYTKTSYENYPTKYDTKISFPVFFEPEIYLKSSDQNDKLNPCDSKYSNKYCIFFSTVSGILTEDNQE